MSTCFGAACPGSGGCALTFSAGMCLARCVLIDYLVCRVAGCLVSRFSSSIGFEVYHVDRFSSAIDVHTGWASIRELLGFAA